MGYDFCSWHLWGSLLPVYMGINFSRFSCIWGVFSGSIGNFGSTFVMNSRILGMLLEETCMHNVYGPIFWHLYTIFMGLTFGHYRYMG